MKNPFKFWLKRDFKDIPLADILDKEKEHKEDFSSMSIDKLRAYRDSEKYKEKNPAKHEALLTYINQLEREKLFWIDVRSWITFILGSIWVLTKLFDFFSPKI